MALSAQHRARLERLPSLVQPLPTLANVPHPAIASSTYVHGVVLRILQLGTEVGAGALIGFLEDAATRGPERACFWPGCSRPWGTSRLQGGRRRSAVTGRRSLGKPLERSMDGRESAWRTRSVRSGSPW